MYSREYLLCFNYFHTPENKMMTKKINIMIDTVAVLFIVSRSNVSHQICCYYESNQNIYGMWRQITREFNMEQIIFIVDEQHLKTRAIFASDILTSM